MTNNELRITNERKSETKLCIVVGVFLAIIVFAGSLSFAQDNVVFKGQVLDSMDKAAEGVEIFIYNTSDTRRPADFISARTGSSGRFSITVPAGKYWAVARMRQGEKYGPLMPGDKHSGEPVEIELEAGEDYEEDFRVIDLRDAARMIKKTREDFFKLEGRVLDRKGAPLKNIYIIANRKKEISKMPDYLSAWTDEEGRYSLYLPAGTYFTGYAAEFPPGEKVYFYREINITAGKNDLDIVVYE